MSFKQDNEFGQMESLNFKNVIILNVTILSQIVFLVVQSFQ